jgi:hypothetical protein
MFQEHSARLRNVLREKHSSEIQTLPEDIARRKVVKANPREEPASSNDVGVDSSLNIDGHGHGTFFAKAHDFTINNGEFTIVHGDQYKVSSKMQNLIFCNFVKLIQ